jgi:caffeoyl-CoA O-methyltransferase
MNTFSKPILLIAVFFIGQAAFAQNNSTLDERVQNYLNSHRNSWHDLNVPYEDGKVLYDLILQHKYTAALEIGTSTGHSTIWLAWAMSKTGGKVVTVERDEKRQMQALKNIEEAGLSDFVEAHLANAHDFVKEVKGPFDFVFSDADKDWYKQYFIDLAPKMKSGGCFTAHNVTDGNVSDSYIKYVNGRADFTSTIDRSSRAGIMISYKK